MHTHAPKRVSPPFVCVYVGGGCEYEYIIKDTYMFSYFM